MERDKPRIGISSCLLGEKVRYDGQHKRDRFLTDTLGKFVQWVPVCPEVEAGMGIPREPVRLVGRPNDPRLIGERSQKDWTPSMGAYSRRRLGELGRMNLSGYILKQNSPSCGMERVRVYGKGNVPNRQGRGLFAGFLMAAYPLLPVEEEGRLYDPKIRENFIERVFALQRWNGMVHSEMTPHALIRFHERHKFLLMAHSEKHLRRMGRLVGETKRKRLTASVQEYGRCMMEALSVRATLKKHTNVLHHILGFFSDRLTPDERKEMVGIIRDFNRELVPLVVPLTLVRHYVDKYEVTYLKDQVYLQPHPKELMLRNHV